MISKVLQKIRNRFTKLCLHPIRVFCLHHITAEFDTVSMCDGDWIEINRFKDSVNQLQECGYTFISLEDAYHKIVYDVLRFRKYAVLTADDGYKSLDEIIPWIIEQHIPITLFINGKYTDGISQREEQDMKFEYLLTSELQQYVKDGHGLVDVQSHGWEHLDATLMTVSDFRLQIDKNISYIEQNHLSKTVGFHAYTWGRHSVETDGVLLKKRIVPVLVDGMKNYDDLGFVHRELFPLNYDRT